MPDGMPDGMPNGIWDGIWDAIWDGILGVPIDADFRITKLVTQRQVFHIKLENCSY
jgi:hypothetical protein